MLKVLGCARGAAARAGERGKDPWKGIQGKGSRKSSVAGGKMRYGGGLEGCCCLSCKEEEFVQGQLSGLEVLLLLLG